MIRSALGFSLHTQNQLPWLVVHLSAISDPRRTLAVGKAGGYTKGDANGCWLGKASLGHVLVEVNRMTSVRLPTASPTFHYRFWGKFPRSQSTKNRGWCPLSNLPPKRNLGYHIGFVDMDQNNSKPCCACEHQSSWYMDIHPPKITKLLVIDPRRRLFVGFLKVLKMVGHNSIPSLCEHHHHLPPTVHHGLQKPQTKKCSDSVFSLKWEWLAAPQSHATWHATWHGQIHTTSHRRSSSRRSPR